MHLECGATSIIKVVLLSESTVKGGGGGQHHSANFYPKSTNFYFSLVSIDSLTMKTKNKKILILMIKKKLYFLREQNPLR